MSLPEYLKRLAAYSTIFFAAFAIAPATHGRPIVSALFTGASPEIEETGIARLNATLEGAFTDNYLGHVFNPLQVLQARNFVQDSTGAGGNPALVSLIPSPTTRDAGNGRRVRSVSAQRSGVLWCCEPDS
jgi:hypothetical protein